MTTRIRTALFAALALFPLVDSSGAFATTQLHTVRVASGLSMPLFVTSPPGDTSRVFIVEQRGSDNRGRIKILKNGVVLARPFLTTAVLPTDGEQGLLCLAFAPDYATSGRFFITYTRTPDNAVVLERHDVSSDPDSANPAGVTILTVAKPATNHNGGWLSFGQDGYLYMTTGDGGGAGDPGDHAQNRNDILGKMLRLDVSGATYTSPPTNPFFGPTNGLDEIWAFGLRNPWRPSFDRLTGDLIIADVGQNSIEEIDFQPASSSGGENYGWRCFEGYSPFSESSTISCGSCLAPGCPKVFPHYQYDHSGGRCSITGGYVYRGCAIPDFQGTYFFADYCAAKIYSGQFTPDTLVNVVDRTAELAPGGGLAINSITSFGEDARGELYICDQGGEVFQIVPQTSVAESDMPVLRRATALGDTLGSTTPGNALMPGITAFADAGSRIRGVGFMKTAAIRECAPAAPGCMESRLRLWPFDVDLRACVDDASGTLTRRFIFTNRSATSRALAYVDMIAPFLNGDEDGATTTAPASGNQSATFTLYDSFQSTRYVLYWATASAGAAFSADVDTASQLNSRVAQDQPLAGATSAGPAHLGLALAFDFGLVAPSAAETVTVFAAVQGTPPSGVEPTPPAAGRVLAVGPVPFHTNLDVALSLSREERVVLDVFDVRGRRVRRLIERTLPAGAHPFHWDGKIESGEPAPAGIYFVRYRGGDVTEIRRAVRVR